MKMLMVVTTILLLFLTVELIADTFPMPQGHFLPRAYLCPRTQTTPVIDGKLDEWPEELFSDDFVDITGDSTLAPTLSTQVAMMWDDTYFYVAVKMEEPNLWATLTEHDAVIFHDNDFEVFIDPDSDTHLYYEYEINALGTDWDLLLLMPYRDRNEVAVNAFEIAGLLKGVHLDGTLNDPSDTDIDWSVELAFPWEVLQQCANSECPPNTGDAWRVNFSRVQWELEVIDGAYNKKPDTPENNWVWSPQGLVAMHYPEMWGLVEFVDGEPGGETICMANPWGGYTHSNPSTVRPYIMEEELIYGMLRDIYYAQKQYYMDHGKYTESHKELGLAEVEVRPEEEPYNFATITVTGDRWQAVTNLSHPRYVIYEDGWVGVYGER